MTIFTPGSGPCVVSTPLATLLTTHVARERLMMDHQGKGSIHGTQSLWTASTLNVRLANGGAALCRRRAFSLST